MNQIVLEEKHLKKYPHFDSLLSMKEAVAIVNSPDRVATHPFSPFIVDQKKYQPYRTPQSVSKLGKPKAKVRDIRSTARRDAVIFTAYRQILAKKYEKILIDEGLSECVIAYRSIPKDSGNGGKCNIEHAADVFSFISEQKNCVAISLDISKYFENIDHTVLKKCWQRVLGKPTLPKDHYQVFKAITRYSWIERTELYKKLGLFSNRTVCGQVVEIPYRKVDKTQLCSREEFRELIKKSSAESNILHCNQSNSGIPQGAPISDLLANMYLLEFDKTVSLMVEKLGGIYRRYSDDIVVVIPGGLQQGGKICSDIRHLISSYGSSLKIKKEKTHTVAFKQKNGKLVATGSKRNMRHVDGLEYLGFRFDGNKVHLRDSTVTRFERKVRKLVKREAMKHVKRNRRKTLDELIDLLDYNAIFSKVGRINNTRAAKFESQTFWSYVRRIRETFKQDLTPKFHKRLQYKSWVHRDFPIFVSRYKRRIDAS